MCGGKGFLGSLFSGGGLGGILGGLAGGALDLFGVPEAGIPLALATGGGSALGSTIGGVASGEPFGKAITSGLESGAITGGLTGLGELATTGDFLGAPGAAASGPLGSLVGGTGPIGAGGDVSAATATPATAGITSAPLPPPAATGGAGAAAGGASGGLPSGGIAAETGGAPGAVPGAISQDFSGGATGPGTLAQSVGSAGPLGNAAGGPNLFASLTDTGSASGVPPSLQGGAGGIPSASPIAPSAGGSFTPDASIQDFAGGTPGPGGVTTPTPGGGVGANLTSYIEKNPGLLLAGGGLLTSIMQGNSIPGIQPIQNQAGLLAGQGNQALKALQTGQLPAGAQAQVDQATDAAKATIRSNFARMGASGSSSEAEALAGIDQAAAATKFQDLNTVTQTGLQEVGAANNLYTTIMNTEIASDKETQDAIARLSAALAGAHGGAPAAA